MRFQIDGPGEVGCVGDGGEVLGPFVADANGIIDVPDDFQEAVRELKRNPNARAYTPPKPKPAKE